MVAFFVLRQGIHQKSIKEASAGGGFETKTPLSALAYIFIWAKIDACFIIHT
jgi:hypothetical protein